MSTPTESSVEGGRPLLRGRVLGFPVHLDLSFLVIMGVFAYISGFGLRDSAIWLLITPFAVLVHELGHAVLARAAGARPEIALAGFGGVTTFVPPHPLSRARSLGISVAGPAVGLLVGGVLYGLRLALGDSIVPGSWQASAFAIGIFTCIGWSLLNLLPVLPLDGGQAMRELLPGDHAVRARRAAMVSIIVAGIVAVVAYTEFNQPFVALFMVFFGVSNILELRRPAAGSGPATPEQGVVHFLWQGEPARAREALAAVPPDTTVDLAVHGAVLALTGDPQQGHALLAQEARRRPKDVNVAALMALTLTLEHDWDGLMTLLEGPIGPGVPKSVLERAASEAQSIGRDDVAGRLTLLTDRW